MPKPIAFLLTVLQVIFLPVHGFRKRDKAEDVLRLEEGDNGRYAYNTMPCSKWQYDVPNDAQSIADIRKANNHQKPNKNVFMYSNYWPYHVMDFQKLNKVLHFIPIRDKQLIGAQKPGQIQNKKFFQMYNARMYNLGINCFQNKKLAFMRTLDTSCFNSSNSMLINLYAWWLNKWKSGSIGNCTRRGPSMSIQSTSCQNKLLQTGCRWLPESMVKKFPKWRQLRDYVMPMCFLEAVPFQLDTGGEKASYVPKNSYGRLCLHRDSATRGRNDNQSLHVVSSIGVKDSCIMLVDRPPEWWQLRVIIMPPGDRIKLEQNPGSGDFLCEGCKSSITHTWLLGHGVTTVGTPISKSLHLKKDFLRGVLQHLNQNDAEKCKDVMRVSCWLIRYGRCESHPHVQCHQIAMLVVRPPEWWQLRDKIMPLDLQSDDPNVPGGTITQVPDHWKLLVDAMPHDHGFACNLKEQKEDHLHKECKLIFQLKFQLARLEGFPGGLLVGRSWVLECTSQGGVFQHFHWGISVNWVNVPANNWLSKCCWPCHLSHCHSKLWMVTRPPEWWQLRQKIMPLVPRKNFLKKVSKLVTRPPEW